MNVQQSHPTHVFVVGGGRWARVIIDVLAHQLPDSTSLSMHTLHNVAGNQAWVRDRGLDRRVNVVASWPTQSQHRCAVVIANAAKDHESAAEWAIRQQMPVLIEKPIATSAAGGRRLLSLAESLSTKLAASNVFLFASSINRFTRIVRESGKLDSLEIEWSDPACEERYGERKHYDVSVPVSVDCLPHIVPIVSVVAGGHPVSGEVTEVRNGGAVVNLALHLKSVTAKVRLGRNEQRRVRLLRAGVQGKVFSLDFSNEPGIIESDATITNEDPKSLIGVRPLQKMLMSFLDWAAGGELDSRLDPRPALHACQISDQISPHYDIARNDWLIKRIAASQMNEQTSIAYALSEILATHGLFPRLALEPAITRIVDVFRGPQSSRWIALLSAAQNPGVVLAEIVASDGPL